MTNHQAAGQVPKSGYSMGTGLEVFRRVLAEVREAAAMVNIQQRIVYYMEAGKTTNPCKG